MSYKIAVGSSDGIRVDLKFGEVKEFVIFEVEDDKYSILETRKAVFDDVTTSCDTDSGLCNSTGCSGNGKGCNGSADIISKVELITDCRCIVCKKIGFQAQKQLERKAISVFDVEGTIEEILGKIIAYYGTLDKRRLKR